MIGMGAEASTIVRAEAADLFCNCGAVKIPSDEGVGDVPGSVHYHAQGLGLESFQDFEITNGMLAFMLHYTLYDIIHYMTYKIAYVDIVC
jgi:hypothetical protein